MLRSHGDVPRTRRPLMALCLQAELIPLRDLVPGPRPQGSLPRSLRGLGALAPSIPRAGQTPSSMVIMELSHLQGRTWRPRGGLRPRSARTSPRSHSCDLRHGLPFSVPPFPSLRSPIRSHGGHPEEFLVKLEARNSWP